MSKWVFIVPGPPAPYDRVAPFLDPKTGKLRMLKPTRMRRYQAKVVMCAKLARIPLLVGPVELLVLAHLAVNPIAQASGDWDNLGKCISDALNGVCWQDDRQVVLGSVRKLLDPQEPRVEVLLRANVAGLEVRPSAPGRGPSASYYPPRPR